MNNIADYKKRLLQLPLVIALVFVLGIRLAAAGVWGNWYESLRESLIGPVEALEVKNGNSQTLEALKPASLEDIRIDRPAPTLVADNSVSLSPVSPEDGIDSDDDMIDQTIIYEVKSGDTLTSVAKMFDISKDTLRWANNLKTDNIKPGVILIVPPIDGVLHEVKKGDTVQSLAKKYKADVDEVYNYNGLTPKSELAVGDMLMIPNGKIAAAPAAKKVTKKAGYAKDGSSRLIDRYTTNYEGYYIRPLSGGRKTQGLHGHNGVDFGAPIGTPIMAAAGGQVIIARPSGYNGGYGEMIMIKHANGTETVYGHLSQVYVTEGQIVNQGDVIGALGNTGKSTGPHLHFEVRGAVNPF